MRSHRPPRKRCEHERGLRDPAPAAVDRLRRAAVHERKTQELGGELEIRGEIQSPDLEAEIDDPFDDDLLSLIFTTCHPVLSTDARVALTLRLLGGLEDQGDRPRIPDSEPTVAQRIVRAKRTLSAARVPSEVPERDELADRLASVLDVIYLIFNEGYATTAGDAWIRPELIEKALRLGRIPRRAASVRAGGSRPRRAALHAQAAIAACHARARVADDTDWQRIVALYDALAQPRPSPVVEAQPRGRRRDRVRPRGGTRVGGRPQLRARSAATTCCRPCGGDLLATLGRDDEARGEFQRAASLTQNSRRRAVLLKRIAGCSPPNGG